MQNNIHRAHDSVINLTCQSFNRSYSEALFTEKCISETWRSEQEVEGYKYRLQLLEEHLLKLSDVILKRDNV